ncbi:POTRA domain-containing protein [Brumimicrobium mesophilum]|uniref:POTRA domain-containing protein n=1 Tax=Brumimicrobium mesophilum TaxID=392717 RepID=UPI00131B1CC9|nr:POTRA domain-containing protein [Brumimicrobium mesophilum]
MIRVFSLLGIIFPFFILGQNSYQLSFISQESNPFKPKKEMVLESKEEVLEYLNKTRSKHIKKGYVLASIDSVEFKQNEAIVHYYRGEKFEKLSISFDEEDAYLISKVPRMNERMISKLPFKPILVEQLLLGLNQYLNNNGFPFSKVFLTVEQIEAGISTAHLNIEKGPPVKIKSVSIKGESKVRDKFVSNAIAIKEGDDYDAELLRNISNKIQQIQFIKEIRPHEILFTPEGAEVFLYLESVPVSLINGIVGLQPDLVTEKTVVTGDVRLKLLNILKRGEELDINWKSLQPQTQELDLSFSFPFLFNTPFGIDTKFDLYKQDSTFLSTNVNFGIRYFLTGGSYIKVFYEANNSNLLSGATSIPNNNLSSLSNNSYGIGLYRNNVDFLPNPSKGFRLSFDISAGRRKSRPTQEDTTTIATTFKGNLNMEVFFPLARRHVIRLANTTRSYYAPIIYQNEVFRFGGLTTQRGFNEELLFATTLTTFTAEYRFLVDRTSHAFAFFDQSFYENNSRDYTSDQPFGFGAGFSFGTNLGIFSISYALGKEFNNPIELKNGKVHFGYVTYF